MNLKSNIIIPIISALIVISCGGGGGGGSTNTSDTNYSQQWHMGEDYLNITYVHQNYRSDNSNIIIQIVDDPIQNTHPDLKDNMDCNNSYDFTTNETKCGNIKGVTLHDDDHGTMVAGIAASRGYNGIGVRGVAPLSKMVSYNLLSSNDMSIFPIQKAFLTGPNANNITVSSNSWGFQIIPPLMSDFENIEAILQQGTSLLRDGKGRIYVVAAGNDRLYNFSSNNEYILNNPYVITVAALNKNNKHTTYSTQGSNILISAYGDEFDKNDTFLYGITTTTFDENNNSIYTDEMGGTSAATPMVSGGIALLIEACPNLTYKDVSYILAKTAIKVDKENPTWVQNSAELYHSIDYGFGKININGAINMCLGENGYQKYISIGTQNSTIDANSTLSVNENIPYNTSNTYTSLQKNITIDDNITIEWIGLHLDLNLTNLTDFEFNLTSPSGTTNNLLQHNSTTYFMYNESY